MAIRSLPPFNFTLYSVDDAVALPTDHCIRVVVQGFWDFALRIAVCPDSDDRLVVFCRILDLPVDVWTISGFR